MPEVIIQTGGGQTTVGAINTNYPFIKNVDVVEGVSAAVAAVITGGTITTLGVSIARVAPAGAVTSAIMQPGVFNGQTCFVVNEAASGDSVTFAAASTSNVSGGTATVIAGGVVSQFMWNVALALWIKPS